MPRARKTSAVAAKHPEVRARERAKKQGLIKKYMATASPYANMGLHYVTGDSPPNTKHAPEDLAFGAAVKLKLLGCELNIITKMLGATDPHALSLQQTLRLEAIARELSAIGETAETHTARAARHKQRIEKLE